MCHDGEDISLLSLAYSVYTGTCTYMIYCTLYSVSTKTVVEGQQLSGVCVCVCECVSVCACARVCVCVHALHLQ